ncbi:MAG: hypothetical protein KDB61_08005, partial [Planctomycetes bacterium]|nr:hypothetical protein [Planctomycetota bacterium]
IKMSDPQRVGDEVAGKVIVERTAIVTGLGSDLAGVYLVDSLREQGWPVSLHSLDLARSTRSSTSGKHVLKVGLFHYADAEDFPATPQQVAPSMTSIEAPVQ